MSTSIDNQRMLFLNQAALELEFPSTRLVWEKPDRACFEFPVLTDGRPQGYTLRLYVNPELPEVCPELYVWHPRILRRVPEGSVNEMGSTHDFHTLCNGDNDRVQICHSSGWDASESYVTAVVKGHLWILAYESHLRTGQPISEYFK